MNEDKKDKQEEIDQDLNVSEENNCDKCQEYLAGWKRALADYDNLNKDLNSKLGEMRRSATAEVTVTMLPVMDNFDQAVKFQPEGLDGKTEQWLSGILHVRTQMEAVLAEMGVTPIGKVGEILDANIHETGGERTEKDKPDQSVLEVVQRGWKAGESILRPARVIINNLEV